MANNNNPSPKVLTAPGRRKPRGLGTNTSSDMSVTKTSGARSTAIPETPELGSTVVSGGTTKFQDANVDTQVDRITSKDSALMQRARATGEAAAARRGLKNTTMGGQAGQGAVYDIALDMGKQNASQIHDRNVSLQGFEQNTRLSDQQFVQESRLADRNFAQNTELSRQGFQQQQQLQQEELANRTELANLDKDTRLEVAKVDANTRLELNEATLNAQEKAESARLLQQADSTYQQAVAAIMANPDLPQSARANQLNNAKNVWQTSRQMVAKMYSVKLQWPEPKTAAAPQTPQAKQTAQNVAQSIVGGGGGGRAGLGSFVKAV